MKSIPTEITAQLASLDALQLAWLSGYCWARAGGQPDAAPAAHLSAAAPAGPAPTIRIISASQTGNARSVAQRLQERLQAAGLAVALSSAADYKPKQISEERLLVLVSSTQGEGEPPEEALSLYKFLSGKKAPALPDLQFAVCGLGDSSYPNFCQAGKSFDQLLADRGATRLLERQDCDLDFQAAANGWIDRLLPKLQALAAAPTTGAGANTATPGAEALPPSPYDRQHPYGASLSVRQKITGRRSDKDVRHLEIDLAGSGLRYEPGDALGVWFENDPALIDRLLEALSLSGSEEVELNGEALPLREVLKTRLELSPNTPQFVRGYAELAQNEALDQFIGADVNALAARTPLVALVERFPLALSATQLVGLLRPLAPRFYSIASAPEEVGEEVHLTVGLLRYDYEGHSYEGACSGYLTQRLAEGDEVRVFVEPNPRFRPPANPEAPMIMIGNGTGIAPFRSFMQARAAAGATGPNWLIFGNPHFTEDFLYQTEWQGYAKEGLLNRYSLAWSRDQAEKVYVQDKIRAEAAPLWQWLQDGAHVYVCGDASRMAKDVEKALLEVIQSQGQLSAEAAEEYLDELRQSQRYQRDIY